MRRILELLAGYFAMTAIALAQGPRDVPEAAEHEVARRGSMAVLTGTVRSDLMTAAFAPPADDSQKWHLTLVGVAGEAQFAKMKEVMHEPAMRHWVNDVDQAASTMHYQCRLISDETQKDWTAKIKPLADKYGLPMVVIQPSRDGKFGDPKTIVKCFHGLHTGKELSAKIQEGIRFYIRTIETGPRAGVGAEEVGVAPPFNRQPAPDVPPPAKVPFDWPNEKPNRLSIADIQKECPGATAKFISQMWSENVTDIEVAKIRWLALQEDKESELKPADQKQELPPAVRPREAPPNFSWPAVPFPASGPLAIQLLLSLSVGVALTIGYQKLVAKIERDAITRANQNRSNRIPTNDDSTSTRNDATTNGPTGWKPPGTNANSVATNG